ncbi:MAG: SDR family oxidoreductase [Deltaproteobacteria bacterium]|nr:SDR family oxidoreductase [Deltaproteobacteria bacterium]
MTRVLIAGCGDVGTELGIRLAGDGHTVWGLRRNCDKLPAGISPFPADLTQPDTLCSLPSAVDVVFYTAAPSSSSAENYRATYVDGVRHLLSALVTQGHELQRFIFASSTGVYAQQSGEWVDESSPTEPVHFSGRELLSAEQIVLRSGFPAIVVRLGGIYGPGRTRLIDSVRHGTAECTAGPPVYTNRIHRDDCAGVLQHVMQLTQPNSVYVAVDNEPAEQSTVLRWLALQLGLPPPRTVPAGNADARGHRSNKRCRNTKLVEAGYVFRYPTFREGYHALLTTCDLFMITPVK